ncbi:MAG: HEAT repeat domain-containing protein [Nitrospirota bacterium]
MRKIQELERLLKDEDIEIRREALENLRGSSGDPYIISLLLRAMEDTSWRVRNAAIDILLEEHPVEAYIGGLINLLYFEDNAGARNSAIEALIKLNKKATPFLIEAFNTPNKDVRKFIIDVLGEFEDSRSLPLMLKAVKDEDENVRATSVERLGRIGEPTVVDALIEILESGDLWTAYPAADALGRIGDRKAIPSLINALEKKELRGPAIRALGLLGEPGTLKNIIPFIEDPSKSIQEETLRSIERFYHKGVDEGSITDEIKRLLGDRVLDILITHARSKNSEVGISAMLLLGLMKDERAYNPLLELSQDEKFREDVMKALVFIGKDKPESLLPLFETDNSYQRQFICEVAGRIASPVYFEALEKLLEDEDGHIRSLAAIAISKLNNPEAIESIKKILSDPYEDVQEAAVYALSNFKSNLSVTELIDMLDDANPALRKNAALLLGGIGATEAVSALGFTLKDDSVRVRKAVVRALSLLKTEDSIRYLTVALTDEEPEVRVMSVLSLGSIGGKGIFEILCLLTSDPDDSVRVATSKALGMLKDDRAVKPLVSLLSDKNGFVVTTAMESLSRIEGDEAKDALRRMLSSKDREVRRTAINALSSFDDVEEELLPFLKDEDWAIRMATVEVLGKRRSEIVRIELEDLLYKEEDPIVRKAVEENLKYSH